MKVVAVDGLINMFKDARTRLNPRDYHSLVEYDTRDTMLLNFIQMLQLADGVELIKCEDCKHWYSDADCGMACEFTNMSQPNDGFCNWGVPKENKADTPQTESTGSPIGDYRDGVGAWQTERMTEEEIDTMLAKVLVGQTDCGWK